MAQKADIVREVAWIYSYRSDQNADKGGEGVQNPENFADVLYVWSPSGRRILCPRRRLRLAALGLPCPTPATMSASRNKKKQSVMAGLKASEDATPLRFLTIIVQGDS